MQIAQYLAGCRGNQLIKNRKKIFKIYRLKYHKVQTLHKGSKYILATIKIVFFMAVAPAIWLLWQLKFSIDLEWEN